MSDTWIKAFEPITEQKLLQASIETAEWIEQYATIEKDTEYWAVLPGAELPEDAFLLKNTSIYAGAAGIALFSLRLYVATKEEQWLTRAKRGINFVIQDYRGVDDFQSDSPFLPGAAIGFLNGPAGGAYVATKLYQVTGEEQYREFAERVTKDLILAATRKDDELFWYGFYGILGEGGLLLYLIDAYETYHNETYLEAAKQGARYILNRREKAPKGGSRWYVMPTESFPTIGKQGGYFPGFEYGAAGCGYILAKIYQHTKEQEFLIAAKEAATYIQNLADYSEDGVAALVRYNDTYLTDLYYLGVCQGPIGTSRLFYTLYQLTKEESYLEFIIQLTNGILKTGAPKVHSRGYWRTNCYCCGAAGMLEHFLHVHQLTGDEKYLDAAYEAAEELLGASTITGQYRNWYTAWNRHEPNTSDPYIGLYHGSAGCASALLTLRQYLIAGESLPPYLEDPYQTIEL